MFEESFTAGFLGALEARSTLSVGIDFDCKASVITDGKKDLVRLYEPAKKIKKKIKEGINWLKKVFREILKTKSSMH